jgi:hypothetical protein
MNALNVIVFGIVLCLVSFIGVTISLQLLQGHRGMVRRRNARTAHQARQQAYLQGTEHILELHHQHLPLIHENIAAGMLPQAAVDGHIAMLDGMFEALDEATGHQSSESRVSMATSEALATGGQMIPEMSMSSIQRLVYPVRYSGAEKDFWANFKRINGVLRRVKGVYIHVYHQRDMKVKTLPGNPKLGFCMTPYWETAVKYCIDLPDFVTTTRTTAS